MVPKEKMVRSVTLELLRECQAEVEALVQELYDLEVARRYDEWYAAVTHATLYGVGEECPKSLLPQSRTYKPGKVDLVKGEVEVVETTPTQ